MKTISLEAAVKLVRETKSLDGYVINDLNDVQVSAVDALALADGGVLIPEQNIVYRDEDVQHDAEFDDYEWTTLPSGTTLEDLDKIVAKKEARAESSSLEIEIADEEVLAWASDNYSLVSGLLQGVLTELYKSRSILSK